MTSTIPQTQKALILDGSPGNLSIESIPVPVPKQGEVLVNVLAAALNPIDYKTADGSIQFVSKFPTNLGSDSAGVIVALGDGVTGFEVGDRVFYLGYFLENELCTFQQYVRSPADIIAKIPRNISFDEASTLPMGIATAAVGLYSPLSEKRGAGLVAPWDEGGIGKYTGEAIVILGGSSSVGQYVIQFAKLSGFSEIITTASEKHFDYLKSLGATTVLSRSSSDANIISSISLISTPKLVCDSIASSKTQDLALEILAASGGGTLVRTLTPDIPKGKDSGINVSSIIASVHYPPNRALGVEMYKALPQLLSDGLIKPNKVEIVEGGFVGVEAALERMRQDKVSGIKLVVRPQE